MLARWFRVLFLISALAVSFLASGPASKADPSVMGWTERVRIHPERLLMEAKLDTGAKTSSIDATEIVVFTRNGKKWVRFKVSNRKGQTVSFERPVVRIARIRRAEAKTTSRPVVTLPLCIGVVFREVQVNLANRSHLNYPMLIGRTSLKGNVIVDPSLKFTKDPMCQGKTPDKG